MYVVTGTYCIYVNIIQVHVHNSLYLLQHSSLANALDHMAWLNNEITVVTIKKSSFTTMCAGRYMHVALVQLLCPS